MKTLYKKIEKYPDYEISDRGIVRKEQGNDFFYPKTGRVNGYETVYLDKRMKYVHKLVAESFVPNPDNKKYVRHIDGNKMNNDFANLVWCSKKEYLYDGWVNNDHKNAKLTNLQKKMICFLRGNFRNSDICEAFGISNATLYNVFNAYENNQDQDS